MVPKCSWFFVCVYVCVYMHGRCVGRGGSKVESGFLSSTCSTFIFCGRVLTLKLPIQLASQPLGFRDPSPVFSSGRLGYMPTCQSFTWVPSRGLNSGPCTYTAGTLPIESIFCVCLCRCVHVCILVYWGVCGGRRSTLGVFFCTPSYIL